MATHIGEARIRAMGVEFAAVRCGQRTPPKILLYMVLLLLEQM